MPQFDPRRSSFHLAPRLFVAVAGIAALGVGLSLRHAAPSKPLAAQPASPVAVAALQAQAFAQSSAPAGFSAPVETPVTVRSGETLQAAVLRTGVAPDEARQVVTELGKAFDTIHIKAGLAFQAAVAGPLDRRGPLRLVGLSLRASPVKSVTLARSFDGSLRLRELEEKVRDETTVAKGQMNGSLYESAEAAGATPTLTAEVAKLFSRKLDFSRDIQPGDEFKLVFDRKVTESGRTVEAGELLYAEIGAKGQVTRFYRFKEPGAAQPEFFDETGKNIKGFLLKTPVDGARVTSGFGMRMHPILGYTRMHQGIDFGVPTGTPVYAAGDGVVEEARWAGGYGRWMKLKHTGGWETAYGHLSGWVVRAGQHVHQGQVIAYSGSTGESTGPHLHYEVMNAGRKIDPKSAKVPAGTILAGRDLAAFRAEKAHVDQLLAGAPQNAASRNLADAGTILLR
ncbi:M23 family metallopeptidase [Phenylobacterium montanum]|uniref:M23 family metallopeptidase n=1 Tax=Phenylobacterium montanum TaxID=2823693 RepID=A0A975FY93_9CAUL|nr:M23 family metallopeptidase [Caulobacter sp. S6]QUD87505.1 M23 family metallopeptidase [Caulobacter sp. S6]